MQISLKTDFADVFQRLRGIEAEIGDKVLARTLNRIANTTRVEAIRKITDEFNIARPKVDERVKVIGARPVAGKLSVTVYVAQRGRKRAINIIAFRSGRVVKSAGGGVGVKVLRRGSRKIIPGTFIANQGRTVFRRVGKERLPIKPVSAIDVPQMFNTRRIKDLLIDNMKANFRKEVERQLAFATRRQ